MAEPHFLPHAPIREAIVEIRVPRVEHEDASAILKGLAEGFGFDQVLQGFQWTADFSVGPDGIMGDNSQQVPHGFKAVSEEYIVRLDLDGVSVSRLEPYTSWDDLVALVRKAWRVFAEAFSPEKVVRVGVRYVNLIRLYPGRDLKEYFLGLPDGPEEWPQYVSSFLFRQTLHEDDSAVNVTHALVDDVDEDRVGVWFDIDAFCHCDYAPDAEDLWGTLAHLRDLKNRVFFSGLTEAAIAEYE